MLNDSEYDEVDTPQSESSVRESINNEEDK